MINPPRRRVLWIVAAFAAMAVPYLALWDVMGGLRPDVVVWLVLLGIAIGLAGPARLRAWLGRRDRLPQWPAWKWSASNLALGTLIVTLLVLYLIVLVAGRDSLHAGTPPPVSNVLGLLQVVVVFVVLGPFTEEVLFRGVALSGTTILLRRWGMRGRTLNIAVALITGVVFAVGHVTDGFATSALRTLPFGIATGLYVAFGGSLRTTIIAHAITNYLSIIPILALYFGGGERELFQWSVLGLVLLAFYPMPRWGIGYFRGRVMEVITDG